MLDKNRTMKTIAVLLGLCAVAAAAPGQCRPVTTKTVTATVRVSAAAAHQLSSGASNSIAAGTGEHRDQPASSAMVDSAVHTAASPFVTPAGNGLTSASGGSHDQQPDGMAPFPLDGPHIAAPQPTDPVPAGAALYTPPGFIFNTTEFEEWCTEHFKSNPSKWLKVAPGTYEYGLGELAPAGADPDANLYNGRNIRFFAKPRGWTLDLRGVTFSIPITPANENRRPGVAIYINQVPDFTILGGTIWYDAGELYTYVKITDLSSTGPGLEGDQQLATLELVPGYNASAWATFEVNARNVACYDITGWPHHVKDASCNFWYMSDYQFDVQSGKGTAKFGMTRSNIKPGMALVRNNPPNMRWAISSEVEGGLRVRGLTTNGGIIQIGNTNGGASDVFEDCRIVNAPARPGFGPRYAGAGLQWGHPTATYNGPGIPDIQFPGSLFQQYGGDQDLISPI